MGILFLDVPRAGERWSKQWNTLLERPTVEWWKDQIQNEIQSGELFRSGHPVELIVAHLPAAQWERLAHTLAATGTRTRPFCLLVSAAGFPTPHVDGCGWACRSTIPMPSDRDLSHLSGRFRRLVNALIDASQEVTLGEPPAFGHAWETWNSVDLDAVLPLTGCENAWREWIGVYDRGRGLPKDHHLPFPSLAVNNRNAVASLIERVATSSAHIPESDARRSLQKACDLIAALCLEAGLAPDVEQVAEVLRLIPAFRQHFTFA